MNTLVRSGDLIVLRCKYSDEWVTVCHARNGTWNPIDKSWTFPYSPATVECIRQNIAPLELSNDLKTENDAEAVKAKREWIEAKYAEIMATETRYESETKPYKHQMIAWDFCKDKPAGGLLMKMGTGKTKVSIDVLRYLQAHKTTGRLRILWLCPNSLIYNAGNEFLSHLGAPVERMYVTGSRKQRERVLAMREGTKPVLVYILNYESVAPLEDVLETYKWDAIVCDESTRIKNPHSSVAKSVIRLSRNIPHRMILTGTPLTQGPLDIFSQYKFLDPTIFGDSLVAFKARYCVMGGFENREIVGFRHIDEIKQKIFSIGIQFTAEECLDLPGKVGSILSADPNVRYYELSTEQRQFYDALKRDLIAEYKNGLVTAQNALTKLLHLRQVCSGFVNAKKLDDDFDGGPAYTDFDKNPKLALLDDTLTDLPDEKVVIWCQFRREISHISQLCAANKRKFVTFFGDTPVKDRQSIVDNFNKEAGNCVFIGQIQTGGLGINLIGAHQTIYYSNSFSLEARLQSEDRTHRIGQNEKCFYTDFVAKNTVEETVLKILRRKNDMANVVTRDTLADFMGEL